LRLAQIDEAIARLMTERRTLKTQLEADLAALRATPLPDDPRAYKAALKAREAQIRERERRYRAELRVLETRIKGLQSEAKTLRAQR
jgi:chromosome segregation ATPase